MTAASPPAARDSLPWVAGRVEHRVLSPADVPALAGAEARCRAAVREVVATGDADAAADPPPDCGAEALEGRLGAPDEWSDVRLRPELSDVVMFHTGGLPQSMRSEEVDRARVEVDDAAAALLDGLGLCPPGTHWALSGHLWYRAGSVMGWHTNTRVPGWRAYLTWVGEPDRSGFRWREPDGGSIETNRDQGLDLRLFHLSAEVPLWHCVWAGTDRHSFGYRLAGHPPT